MGHNLTLLLKTAVSILHPGAIGLISEHHGSNCGDEAAQFVRVAKAFLEPAAPENGEDNYGADKWREPTIQQGDTVIFSECGRIMDRIDYRSHWMMLIRAEFGGNYLMVKHGGGQERFKLGWSNRYIEALGMLDSNNRYFMLHEMLKINHDAASNATDETKAKYAQAFANGTLKKRKQRGSDNVKVWIDDNQFSLG